MACYPEFHLLCKWEPGWLGYGEEFVLWLWIGLVLTGLAPSGHSLISPVASTCLCKYLANGCLPHWAVTCRRAWRPWLGFLAAWCCLLHLGSGQAAFPEVFPAGTWQSGTLTKYFLHMQNMYHGRGIPDLPAIRQLGEGGRGAEPRLRAYSHARPPPCWQMSGGYVQHGRGGARGFLQRLGARYSRGRMLGLWASAAVAQSSPQEHCVVQMSYHQLLNNLRQVTSYFEVLVSCLQNGNLRKQTSKSKPNEILPHTLWDGYYLEKKGVGKEKEQL